MVCIMTKCQTYATVTGVMKKPLGTYKKMVHNRGIENFLMFLEEGRIFQNEGGLMTSNTMFMKEGQLEKDNP